MVKGPVIICERKDRARGLWKGDTVPPYAGSGPFSAVVYALIALSRPEYTATQVLGIRNNIEHRKSATIGMFAKKKKNLLERKPGPVPVGHLASFEKSVKVRKK